MHIVVVVLQLAAEVVHVNGPVISSLFAQDAASALNLASLQQQASRLRSGETIKMAELKTGHRIKTGQYKCLFNMVSSL